jgi:hypothetical protein
MRYRYRYIWHCKGLPVEEGEDVLTLDELPPLAQRVVIEGRFGIHEFHNTEGTVWFSVRVA